MFRHIVAWARLLPVPQIVQALLFIVAAAAYTPRRASIGNVRQIGRAFRFMFRAPPPYPPFRASKALLRLRSAMLSKNRVQNDKIDGLGQVGMVPFLFPPSGILCDLVFCRELLALATSCVLFCLLHLPRTVDFGVFAAKKRQDGWTATQIDSRSEFVRALRGFVGAD